jgi:hypothetical protein
MTQGLPHCSWPALRPTLHSACSPTYLSGSCLGLAQCHVVWAQGTQWHGPECSCPPEATGEKEHKQAYIGPDGSHLTGAPFRARQKVCCTQRQAIGVSVRAATMPGCTQCGKLCACSSIDRKPPWLGPSGAGPGKSSGDQQGWQGRVMLGLLSYNEVSQAGCEMTAV